MSRLLSDRLRRLTPYTPGEQPQTGSLIKLNTNESPYPPSEAAMAFARQQLRSLQLYSDPDSKLLRQALAERYGIQPAEVLVTNGSDEALNFAFLAFADADRPPCFADITYGFYQVFADLYGLRPVIIPLRADFTLNPADIPAGRGPVFIANPNAPTGLALRRQALAALAAAQSERLFVIDEAYVDFGAESCVPLIHELDNVLVTQTFSKSRSFAGGRLGFAIGCRDLIADLNTVRNSTNPYNVNSLTTAVGLGILHDEAAVQANCAAIMNCRAWTIAALRALGFEVTDSVTNFVFARHPLLSGETIYRLLKERGILVRHFDAPRIRDYNRITIGTQAQMETLLNTLKTLLEENAHA